MLLTRALMCSGGHGFLRWSSDCEPWTTVNPRCGLWDVCPSEGTPHCEGQLMLPTCAALTNGLFIDRYGKPPRSTFQLSARFVLVICPHKVKSRKANRILGFLWHLFQHWAAQLFSAVCVFYVAFLLESWHACFLTYPPKPSLSLPACGLWRSWRNHTHLFCLWMRTCQGWCVLCSR